MSYSHGSRSGCENNHFPHYESQPYPATSPHNISHFAALFQTRPAPHFLSRQSGVLDAVMRSDAASY